MHSAAHVWSLLKSHFSRFIDLAFLHTSYSDKLDATNLKTFLKVLKVSLQTVFILCYPNTTFSISLSKCTQQFGSVCNTINYLTKWLFYLDLVPARLHFTGMFSRPRHLKKSRITLRKIWLTMCLFNSLALSFLLAPGRAHHNEALYWSKVACGIDSRTCITHDWWELSTLKFVWVVKPCSILSQLNKGG